MTFGLFSVSWFGFSSLACSYYMSCWFYFHCIAVGGQCRGKRDPERNRAAVDAHSQQSIARNSALYFFPPILFVKSWFMTLNCTQTVKYVMYIYLRPMEFSTHAYGIFKIDFVYDVDWCVCVFFIVFCIFIICLVIRIGIGIGVGAMRCGMVWCGCCWCCYDFPFVFRHWTLTHFYNKFMNYIQFIDLNGLFFNVDQNEWTFIKCSLFM